MILSDPVFLSVPVRLSCISCISWFKHFLLILIFVSRTALLSPALSSPRCDGRIARRVGGRRGRRKVRRFAALLRQFSGVRTCSGEEIWPQPSGNGLCVSDFRG